MSAKPLPNSPAELRDKKATLIGLGARTHVSLARFLVKHGAIVTISDAKPADKLDLEIGLLGDLPVKLSLGGHFEQDIVNADIIFVTPGASRDMPVLRQATAMGIPISSEIELLFRLCPASIVGITGSSGKTTTTSLVADMLRADGRRTFLGGNIGIPLIDRLDEMAAEDWVVLELSSFQLEHMTQSPHVAAVLNITPNHLDRHDTMEKYIAAKGNIVVHQSKVDWAILGQDDANASALEASCPGQIARFSIRQPVQRGAYLQDSDLRLRWDSEETTICRQKDIFLLGQHNVLNTLAAAAVARACGASTEAIASAATSFRGVEHRLELVRELRGVRFFNDSIATSPERTLAALKSFPGPVILIAGGKSKHLPLDVLVAEIGNKVRYLLLMGELGEEIQQAIDAQGESPSIPVVVCSSLEEAVLKASQVANDSDIVLLSPGGTSFDSFRDFEDRGKRFKDIVSAL